MQITIEECVGENCILSLDGRGCQDGGQGGMSQD